MTDSTETQKPARGGAGRGQGRKPLAADTVRYALVMTPEQRAKLDALGNAEWIRAQIDAAPLTPSTPQ